MLLSRCYVLQVAFALLGCIPGSIGLRGTFAPQGDEQDTVKVGPQKHTGALAKTSSAACYNREIFNSLVITRLSGVCWR